MRSLRQRWSLIPLLLFFVMLSAVGFACFRAAQARILEPPPLVRLTGEIAPVNDEAKRDISALFVLIDETERMLVVRQAEILTSDYRGTPVLQRLFPRQMRIIGETALLQELLKPEMIGKPIVVEGYLYFDTRQLLVADLYLKEDQVRQALVTPSRSAHS